MTQQADIFELIDYAYQAAVDPSLWPKALAHASDLFGGSQTAVIRSEPGRTTPLKQMNTLDDPLALPAYLATYGAINPLQAAVDRGLAAGFMPIVSTDETYLQRREFERSDFYNGYFSRFDMHNVLMTAMPANHLTLNVIRPPGCPLFDGAEIELARAVQPALSRAFELNARMQAVRAVSEGLAAFAERSSEAAILVNSDGRVVHANGAAETLFAQADGLLVHNGALHAADADAGRRLDAMVGRAAGNDAANRSGGSLALPRPSGRRGLAVLVAPARSEFGGEGPRLALVSITDPDKAMALPLDRMQDLFGLTASEAHVVAELVAGHGPRAIAARRGVSHHTVRVQLARAMAKTDTTRQSDLVALMIRALGGGAPG